MFPSVAPPCFSDHGPKVPSGPLTGPTVMMGPMALLASREKVDPGNMPLIDNGLELLSEDECLALLACSSLGRVAVTLGALPAVLPVNYGILDGDIVFFTGPGTKLSAAVRNAVVAFEVDEIDSARHTGWSVLAVGMASEVTDDDEIARVRALGIRPWAGGQRPHLVRLRPEFLSGRRITGDEEPY
jgi:nitroimidazol reductase NimA-like FMN-containing flavoprotein (pyridoxamine 5'-phosphate oxidase superfamily)